LFPCVIVGNFSELGSGNFYEISKDVVELDFQGIDPRSFAFIFLKSSDPIFSAAGCGAEFIELGIITVSDDVAVFNICWRFVG
jgi:hypothetical protein